MVKKSILERRVGPGDARTRGSALWGPPHTPGDIMAAHMKTTIVCLAALVLAPAAAPSATLDVIPQPVSVEMQTGAFRLHSGVAIVAPPGW